MLKAVVDAGRMHVGQDVHGNPFSAMQGLTHRIMYKCFSRNSGYCSSLSVAYNGDLWVSMYYMSYAAPACSNSSVVKCSRERA